MATKPEPVDVYICVTCQRDEQRPGAQLHASLHRLTDRASVRLHAVECMSVCSRACTIAVSSPGKWTYVIGDLDPELHAHELCDYLTTYAHSENGTPPLKERPASIRRGTIARIPPLAI